MSAQEFVFWMQGYFAALGEEPPTAKDWRVVKAKLVEFTKEPDTSKLFAGMGHVVPSYPPGVRSAPSPSRFGQPDPFAPTLSREEWFKSQPKAELTSTLHSKEI